MNDLEVRRDLVPLYTIALFVKSSGAIEEKRRCDGAAERRTTCKTTRYHRTLDAARSDKRWRMRTRWTASTRRVLW